MAQAHFLLGDVEFFEIIDKLLLEAVLVVLSRSGQLGKVFRDALLDDFVAVLLVRLHLFQKVEDQVDAMQQVFLQGLTFLDAEAIDQFQGLVEGLTHFAHKGIVVARHRNVEDAGHTEEQSGHVVTRRNMQILRNLLDLVEISFHDVLVDMVGLGQIGIGDCDHHVDLAALQLGGDVVAKLQLSRTQFVGCLDLKVELLAVERLDLN